MAQLKLDGTKLFHAMNYINEINSISLLDIDFSDLFDDKKDNKIENLELWITKQPKGQRPEDLIEYAEWILKNYKINK